MADDRTDLHRYAMQIADRVRDHLLTAISRHNLGENPTGYVVVSRTDASGGQWFPDFPDCLEDDDDVAIPLRLYRTSEVSGRLLWSSFLGMLGYRFDGVATKCDSLAHAAALVWDHGGWVIDHGDVLWHTTNGGTAEDLTLPLVDEDRERAERAVSYPLTGRVPPISRAWIESIGI